MQLTVAHGAGSDRWQILYLPGSAMVALPGEDEMISERVPGAAEAFRHAARGVQPYPVPTVTGATVGGRPVADPASYLALFGVDSGANAYPTEPDFVPILLRSTRSSPWTGAWYFPFSPSAGVLTRAGEVVEQSDALAASTAARESLAAGVSRGRSGFDWPLVCVALASAFGVALVAALLTRRGRRPATA